MERTEKIATALTSMTNRPSKFEMDVLLTFCEANDFPHPDIKKQIQLLSVHKRENTGAGIYVYFKEDTGEPIDNEVKVTGVFAGRSPDSVDLGFILYLENGVVSMLEGFSYTAHWPADVSHYTIYLG